MVPAGGIRAPPGTCFSWISTWISKPLYKLPVWDMITQMRDNLLSRVTEIPQTRLMSPYILKVRVIDKPFLNSKLMAPAGGIRAPADWKL